MNDSGAAGGKGRAKKAAPGGRASKADAAADLGVHVEEGGDGQITLSEPRAIKALAHPARLAILEVLLSGEQLTSTECAELTGLSPSATNYHLKALEKWGLVEAADPRADGRDRPWRAKGRSVQVSTEEPGRTALAETALASSFMDRNHAIITGFMSGQPDEPPEWRGTAELANGDFWLTAAEVREVSDVLTQALEKYRGRGPGEHPVGARRVRVVRMVVPHPAGKPVS